MVRTSPYTVDEKILELQACKQALADDIYRTGKEGNALAALSAEEILSLFA
jgi:SNF2 family DNA or RNA helicase